MEEKNQKIIIFFISLFLLLITVALLRKYGKIANDFSAFLIFFLSAAIIFFILFLYKKSTGYDMEKAKEYPLEEVKHAIRKRALEDYELRGIKEEQWKKLFGLIPLKKMEKYYVPDLEFTNRQQVYNLRGNHRCKVEFKILSGKYKGMYHIDASLSKHPKFIEMGNFTRIDQNIYIDAFDRNKFNPEPPVTKLEQEISAILPLFEGNAKEALNYLRGQQSSTQMQPAQSAVPGGRSKKKKWYNQRKASPPSLSDDEGGE